MKMKVIVPVSDKYRYLMPVFAQLFNKYWPDQECVVLCFKDIEYSLPDNFTVHSIGVDTGYWTTNLRKYFRTFKDEYFVLHLEDHILCEYVKLDKLKIMEEEMKNGADKAMLHSHLNIVAKPLHNDVLIINQDADYRTSIHTAIWKTEYFSRHLHHNRSVWGFEVSPEAKNDGAKIVSLKSKNRYHDHIVNFINLLRGGKIDSSMTGLWHEEDLEILLTLPMDDENRDVLIRRCKNNCFQCGQKVDLMLMHEKEIFGTYERTGICQPCQRGER